MKALLTNKLLLMIFCTVLLGNACNKDDEMGWTDATIIDSGSESVDGCGILILVGEEYYSPVSIDDIYVENRLEVKIKYTLQDAYKACGFSTMERTYQKIDITQIRKK